MEHPGKAVQEEGGIEEFQNHPKNRLFPKDVKEMSCLVFWRAGP